MDSSRCRGTGPFHCLHTWPLPRFFVGLRLGSAARLQFRISDVCVIAASTVNVCISCVNSVGDALVIVCCKLVMRASQDRMPKLWGKSRTSQSCTSCHAQLLTQILSPAHPLRFSVLHILSCTASDSRHEKSSLISRIYSSPSPPFAIVLVFVLLAFAALRHRFGLRAPRLRPSRCLRKVPKSNRCKLLKSSKQRGCHCFWAEIEDTDKLYFLVVRILQLFKHVQNPETGLSIFSKVRDQRGSCSVRMEGQG